MTFAKLFDECSTSDVVDFLSEALEKVAPTIVCDDALYDRDEKTFRASISDDDEPIMVVVKKQDKSYAIEVSFDEDGYDCSDVYEFSPKTNVEEALAKAL